LRRHKPERSLLHFREAAEVFPKGRAGLFALAKALSRTGERDEAVKVLQAALSRFPESRDATYERLIDAARKRPDGSVDSGSAVKWAQEWTRQSPGCLAAWSRLGDLLRRTKQWDASVNSYRTAAAIPKLTPLKRTMMMVRMVRALERAGKRDEAEKAQWEILSASDRASCMLRGGVRWALLPRLKASGKLGQAIQKVRAEQERTPDSIAVLWNLAALYRANGDLSSGIDCVKRIIDLAPDRFPAISWEIFCVRWPDSAKQEILANWKLPIYEAYVRKIPAVRERYASTLLHFYRRLKKDEQAKQLAEEILHSGVREVSALSAAATYYREVGEADKAIGLLDRAVALALDPGQRDKCLLSLVDICKENGDADKLRAVASELSATGQDSRAQYRASLVLTELLRKSGSFEKFVQELEDRVDRNPEDGNTVRQLATMQVIAGNRTEAAEAYLRLAQLDPGNFQILITTSDLLRALKRYDDLILLHRAYLDAPKNFGVNNVAGLLRAYLKAGRLQEVVGEVADLTKRPTRDANALRRIGDVLLEAGHPGRAQEVYERSLSMGRVAHTRWYAKLGLARACLLQGQSKRARGLAESLVKEARNVSDREKAQALLNEIGTE